MAKPSRWPAGSSSCPERQCSGARPSAPSRSANSPSRSRSLQRISGRRGAGPPGTGLPRRLREQPAASLPWRPTAEGSAAAAATGLRTGEPPGASPPGSGGGTAALQACPCHTRRDHGPVQGRRCAAAGSPPMPGCRRASGPTAGLTARRPMPAGRRDPPIRADDGCVPSLPATAQKRL